MWKYRILTIGIIIESLSMMSISPFLYAEPYSNQLQQTVTVADIDIQYAGQRSTTTDMSGRVFSIENGRYVQAPSSQENTSPWKPLSTSIFKNAFDCILTRSMLDFSGNIPLELYTQYHMNPSSCMDGSVSSTTLWWFAIAQTDSFITIWSYTIEKTNHGRPQNPVIEINPMNYSADRPQAWSQTTLNADQSETVGWYYNSLWAKSEWDYLGLYLPFASDYSLILSMDRSMLDLASWGYSTINYPLMISRDIGSAYYWTDHPTGQTGYMYGVYSDPVAGKSMEINVKSDANMMLPVRFIKW